MYSAQNIKSKLPKFLEPFICFTLEQTVIAKMLMDVCGVSYDVITKSFQNGHKIAKKTFDIISQAFAYRSNEKLNIRIIVLPSDDVWRIFVTDRNKTLPGIEFGQFNKESAKRTYIFRWDCAEGKELLTTKSEEGDRSKTVRQPGCKFSRLRTDDEVNDKFRSRLKAFIPSNELMQDYKHLQTMIEGKILRPRLV